MVQIVLLEEIAIIAAVSVMVTVVLGRMKLPTTAGLLFSGALLGPHGLELASDVHAIETIAEAKTLADDKLINWGVNFTVVPDLPDPADPNDTDVTVTRWK